MGLFWTDTVEDTVEGIIHHLVSNTEVKDGSLLAAVKSVVKIFSAT